VLSARAARAAAPGSFVDMRPTGHGGEDEDDDDDDDEEPDQHHEFQVGETAWFWHIKIGDWREAKVRTINKGEKVLKYKYIVSTDYKGEPSTPQPWADFFSLKKNQELNLVRTVQQHEAWPDEPCPLPAGMAQNLLINLGHTYKNIPSLEGFRFFPDWNARDGFHY